MADNIVVHNTTIPSINTFAAKALAGLLKEIIYNSTTYVPYKQDSNVNRNELFIGVAPIDYQNKILDLPVTQVVVAPSGFSAQIPFIGKAEAPTIEAYDALFTFVYVNMSINVIAASYSETDQLATLIYVALLHDGTQAQSDFQIQAIKPTSCSTPMPLSASESDSFLATISGHVQLDANIYLTWLHEQIANGIKIDVITPSPNSHTILHW